MRFVIEQKLGRPNKSLDLHGKTLVVPSPSGIGVRHDVAEAIRKAAGQRKGFPSRTRLPGAGYVEVDLIDLDKPAATNTLATYRCRIEGEVHDPEVFELGSECFVQWHVYHESGDNEGDPTGRREKVQVTHIRCDADADFDGEGYVDHSAYYIAEAHRDESGEAIPWAELGNLGAITSECLNGDWLTEDDEDYLADCIRSRADDIAQAKAGY
jgi:hypothetical protein